MSTGRDARSRGALGRAARMLTGLAVLLGAIASARADVATVDVAHEQAPAATAEASHRAAVAAYARGHYRDAIDLFMQADRLRPSPAFSFNIARCYEQLDDAPSALAWYRDYLRRSSHPTDAAAVERVIARFERRLAQKGVQQVSVLSAPAGATVVIDGTPVGVSPWTGALAPGVHSVELTLAGYQRASERFELAPEHAQDVELTLVSALDERGETSAPIATRANLTLQRQRMATNARRDATARSTQSVLNTAGWIAVGAGGAALVGAAAFEVLRRNAEADAKGEDRQIRFAQAVDTMQSRQTAARVLAGTAAGLGIAGGVLLIVAAGQDERAPGPQLGLACTPRKCNASITGRF